MSDNKLNIQVVSSEGLTDEQKELLKKVISDKLVRCHQETDKGKIGGLSMQIGDTVYDGTIEHAIDRFTASDASYIYDENKHVSDDVQKQISAMNTDVDIYQVGRVKSVGDGICRVVGISDCMAGEMLEFPRGLTGMAMDLTEKDIGVILFGKAVSLQEGDEVKRTGRILSVPVGDGMIGRVVDALGRPIDGKEKIKADGYRNVESPAPDVLHRHKVNVPLQTGIKAIDSLVPIGRGQRELIIGDRQTGKTQIALDTIINQKGKDVICVYVAVGQKESTVVDVVRKLREHGAMDYTTVVCASASESATMLYIAPYSGCAIGEYFMYKGKDVLIVYDDLSKQAVAYREISLLLQRPPGREAFPGDIFYLHSRLLERAAKLSDDLGGGSMTALPIIETQAGDIAAYIPTNVISITDGQIFLESDLFHAGTRPAINVGLSVSRVGGDAQLGAMKQFSGKLRMNLAQYRELAAFSQFGSDLDAETQATLNRGAHMTEVIKQGQFSPLSVTDQVIQIVAASEGYTDNVPLDQMADFETGVVEYVKRNFPELEDEVMSGKKLGKESVAKLRKFIAEYRDSLA